MNRNESEKIFEQIINEFHINKFEFDIFMIKKLAPSNTLHESNSNQTHIAITGNQIDVFPYLENYGHLVNGLKDFKKRFILKIPVFLSENNLKYLNNQAFGLDGTYFETYTHFNRSKRGNDYQGELSYLKGDEEQFINNFRKKIKAEDYLVVIKVKEKFEYLFIGLKNDLADRIIKRVADSIYDEKEKQIFIKNISSATYFENVNPGAGKNVTQIGEDNIIEVDESQIFDENKTIKMFIEWMIDIKKLAFKTMENYSKRYLPKIIEDLLELEFITNRYEFYSKNSQILEDLKNKYFSIDEIKEKNSKSNRSFSATFGNYIEFQKYFENKNLNGEFLEKEYTIKEEAITWIHEFPKNKLHQKIIYGAPGTGKSQLLKDETKGMEEYLERVTFYDGYTYGQFIGSYKPVTILEKSDSNKSDITYEYVSGPLFRHLVKAFNNPNHNFVIIIEEINRARADKVFGNIFQLLDRDNSGKSEYPISLSEEQERYFRENLEGDIYFQTIEKNSGLYLPANLYIWATMNSADQGVYPMDSAFKRRWNFQYIKLNQNSEKFGSNQDGNKEYEYFIPLYKTLEISDMGNPKYEVVEWNKFRSVINKIMLHEVGVPEDRLIAPFFVKPENFENIDLENKKDLWINAETYKSKILMYLFDDVLRHRGKDKIFDSSLRSFSELIEAYDRGDKVFNDSIVFEMLKPIVEEDGES